MEFVYSTNINIRTTNTHKHTRHPLHLTAILFVKCDKDICSDIPILIRLMLFVMRKAALWIYIKQQHGHSTHSYDDIGIFCFISLAEYRSISKERITLEVTSCPAFHPRLALTLFDDDGHHNHHYLVGSSVANSTLTKPIMLVKINVVSLIIFVVPQGVNAVECVRESVRNRWRAMFGVELTPQAK